MPRSLSLWLGIGFADSCADWRAALGCALAGFAIAIGNHFWRGCDSDQRGGVGVGTVLNGISIGPGADLVMPLLPKLDGFGQQLLCLAVGLLVVAIAAGLYISAELGAGPRDGLMVGLTRVSNRPFWVIRTLGEGTVLLTGWLLGGNAGVGTAIFAVSIGYMMQTSMKFFGFDPKSGAKSPKSTKSAGLEAEISSGIE